MILGDFSLVIPVRTLFGLTPSVREISCLDPKNIIIVYDHAEEIDLNLYSQFSLVKSRSPGRVGMAILQGIDVCQTSKVVVTMGDGCDSWSDLNQISNLLDTYDLVNMNRLSLAGFYQGGNLAKELTTRLAAILLKIKWNWQISDPTNNFKGFRKDLFHKISKLENDDFSIGLEIILKAHLNKLRLIEINSKWSDDSKSYVWVNRIKSYVPFLINKENKYIL